MATTTKASRLQAVNTIISNIGQSPVTSLESGNPLVEMAEQILDEVTRTVQAEGWSFNIERHYPFAPDPDGYITIPDNVLGLDTATYAEADVVIRDGRLYDKYNHTYIFSEAQELDVVWLFDFMDMPEVFKSYVTIRAANVFAGRSVASVEAVRFGEREEILARAAVMEHECQQADYSFFGDSVGRGYYNSLAYRPLNAVWRR